MARRTFDVVDIIEILVHWHAGRSRSEIAQSLGVDRKTASKYIAAAKPAPRQVEVPPGAGRHPDPPSASGLGRIHVSLDFLGFRWPFP
jgi:hypothetical protein